MEKNYLNAVDMLKIASDHAYCADYLLKQNGEVKSDHYSIDALLPIISLIHMAFELTFKGYLIHEQGKIKPYKTLHELMELNSHLGLAKVEQQLISTLSRLQAFRKGIDYNLWKNRQELQVFCEQMLTLYARLQTLMPIELQSDYR